MKCLVTGATGFIGRNLVKRLKALKLDVHSYYRYRTVALDKEFGINTSYNNLDYAFTQGPYDVVFHLAAKCFTEYDTEDIEDIIESNITLGVQLLELMRAYNCRQLVYAGTNWSCFDGEQNHPLNLYAATKTAFAEISKVYAEQHNIKIVILRLFDNYGLGDTRLKVINRLVDAIYTGKSVPLVSENKILDLTHIDDVCNAFITAASISFDDKKLKTFDVAGTQIPLGELVRMLEVSSGVKIDVQFGAYPSRPVECDTPAYFEALPNWYQTVRLRDGLKQLILQYRN